MQKNLLKLCITSVLLFNASEWLQADQASNKDDEQYRSMIQPTRAPNPQGKIKLFVYQGCPYCHKVTQLLTSQGNLHKVLVLDANKNMEEFTKSGGKGQCPFLVDEPKGVHMHESAYIMKYLSNRF